MCASLHQDVDCNNDKTQTSRFFSIYQQPLGHASFSFFLAILTVWFHLPRGPGMYSVPPALNVAPLATLQDVDWVKVPRIYWEYSKPEMLVMEYCPGCKINDAAAIEGMGLDRKKLARLSVESYLQQILRHGFFHADPHPGNVAVDAENGGRLIYYDFGMMGAIPGDVRGGLLELFYGVYNKWVAAQGAGAGVLPA